MLYVLARLDYDQCAWNLFGISYVPTSKSCRWQIGELPLVVSIEDLPRVFFHFVPVQRYGTGTLFSPTRSTVLVLCCERDSANPGTGNENTGKPTLRIHGIAHPSGNKQVSLLYREDQVHKGLVPRFIGHRAAWASFPRSR